MDQNKPELLRPALVAGLLSGVLASLPLANCCCCLWPLAGGFLAVFLYQKQSRVPMTGGDGAVLGALTGLTAAFVRAVLLIPLQRLNLQFMQKVVLPYVLELFERSGEPPPPQIESLVRGELPLLTVPAFFLDLFLSAALFAGLSALGGVIAVSLFRKKTPSVPEDFHVPQNPSDRQP